MQTKNAIGNLLNKYRAVLRKCRWKNSAMVLAMSLALGVATPAVVQANSYADVNDYSESYRIVERLDGDTWSVTVGDTVYTSIEYVGTNVTGGGYVIDVDYTFTVTGKNANEESETLYFAIKTADGAVGLSTLMGTHIVHTSGTYSSTISPYFIYLSGDTNGGAIFNSASIDAINSYFVSNTANNSGGAIYNYSGTFGTISSIGYIKASFSDNHANSGNGGAIYNSASSGTANIETIEASFSYNYASGSGGAIYNYAIGSDSKASIKNITGDFTDNMADSGGAIFNSASSGTASIGDINGSFNGNMASGDGGAISNSASSGEASISSIKGNFGENSVSDGGGGAISNYATGSDSKASIGGIEGNFYSNIINNGSGGAIYNYAVDSGTASIGGSENFIIGDFGYNDAGGSGGAIYNYAVDSGTASIGDITGSFSYNDAGGSGGAIYNYAVDSGTAIIGDITGDFTNNMTGGSGGAIYNYAGENSTASIGTITGSFTKNTADGDGGAVYTNTDMTFKAASSNSEMTDNKDSQDSTGYNAIYVAENDNNNDTVIITFDVSEGNYTVNDSIKAENGVDVDIVITGETETYTETETEYYFQLNDAVSGNVTITVENNAILSLNEYPHTDITTYGPGMGTDTALTIPITVNGGASLYIGNVGNTLDLSSAHNINDNVSRIESATTYLVHNSGRTYTFGSGGSILLGSTVLDVASGLYIGSGACLSIDVSQFTSTSNIIVFDGGGVDLYVADNSTLAILNATLDVEYTIFTDFIDIGNIPWTDDDIIFSLLNTEEDGGVFSKRAR